MTTEQVVTGGDVDDDDDWEDPPRQPPGSSRFNVRLPSGSVQPVLNQEEVDYLTERVHEYDSQIKFTNVSDLQDLDRILVWELLVHRWGIYVGQGSDYDGEAIDPNSFSRDLDKKSSELRMLKKLVGLDKVTRDKQKGEGSLHLYIQQLLVRAKEFGINREQQLDKALELVNELIGMVTFFRNSTQGERKEFAHTEQDILDWIWDVLRPEYEAIDAEFRERSQKFWVRLQG